MSSEKPVIEYYFSFISLWSYVGSLEFQALVQELDATVVYKPVDLLAVFAAGGGKPVRERAPARQAYRLIEMQRWRKIRNIDLVLHPKYYPADPGTGHRMLLAALQQGHEVAGFVHAALRAVWADELNIADPGTLAALADANGLDGAALLAQAEQAAALRASEDRLTQEAISRQVFGAPFYFYRDEAFWGQDRLGLLQDMITSGREAYRNP